MVSDEGRFALPGYELESATTTPPASAAAVSPTVNVADCPLVSTPGLAETQLNTGPTLEATVTVA